MWTKRAGQSPNANGEASELNTYVFSFTGGFSSFTGGLKAASAIWLL